MGTDLAPDSFPKLLPWQRVYAGWLMGFDKTPSQPKRLHQAKIAATYAVKPAELKALESRADFRAYCADLQASAVARARHLVETEATVTMQQMLEMRDQAHREGDYAKFMQYAGPILDRVWPKQDDRGPGKTQVVINLSGGFAAKVMEAKGEIIEETDVLVLANPESEG